MPDTLLLEDIRKQLLKSKTQAGLVAWPAVVAYFVLAVEKSELLNPWRSAQAKPPQPDEKLSVSFVTLPDAVKAYYAFLHSNGKHTVVPVADEDGADAVEEFNALRAAVYDLFFKAWKGQYLSRSEVLAVLVDWQQHAKKNYQSGGG
jgi:hypothetical protein